MWNGHILKVQVDIPAGELCLEFAPMDLDSDETSRDIDTAVLHRISISFIWAERFGLGSHFWKSAQISRNAIFFSKYACPFFQEQVPKMSFLPSVHQQLPWLVLQYFQIHRLYQNGWSFGISRFTSYIRMAGFSMFPGPQSVRLTDDPYFIFISYYFHICFTSLAQIPIPASSIQWILQV